MESIFLTGNESGGTTPFSYSTPGGLFRILPMGSYTFPNTAGGIYDIYETSAISYSAAWQGTIDVYDADTNTLLVELTIGPSGGSTHHFQFYDGSIHCNLRIEVNASPL